MAEALRNESFVQVPLNLSDEAAVRRCLNEIVIAIDLIKGNRADDPYVSQSELDEEVINLDTLNTDIESLEERMNNAEDDINSSNVNVEEIQQQLSELQYTLEHLPLDATYNDFDNAVWGMLRGNGQFSALGSAMTNPPFAVVAGTTYTVYANSIQTTGGGVVQRVLMEETGVDLRLFYRTGDTFATAVSNGWVEK